MEATRSRQLDAVKGGRLSSRFLRLRQCTRSQSSIMVALAEPSSSEASVTCRAGWRRPRACAVPLCQAVGPPPAAHEATPEARGAASGGGETRRRRPSSPAYPWYISNASVVRRPFTPHLPLDLSPRDDAPDLLPILRRLAPCPPLQHHECKRRDVVYGACIILN